VSDRTLVHDEERHWLLGERDSLIASIDDLEREHDGGDLSEDDYHQLLNHYTVMLAKVLRAIGEDAGSHENLEYHEISRTTSPRAAELPDRRPKNMEVPDTPTPDDSGSLIRSNHRVGLRVSRAWRLVITGILLVVVALSVVLVVKGTSQRLPGEAATGSVNLDPQQRLQRNLAQAESLEAQGNASEALKLYHQVLVQDPNQGQALAESGWLEYEAGVLDRNSSLLADGQTEELKAQRVGPNDYAPHLYLGSMMLVEGNDSGAVAEYRLFLEDHPPTSTIKSAATFIDRAFESEGIPPPPLPAG
jgi:tetratricopeptide (TPR) repeat protein